MNKEASSATKKQLILLMQSGRTFREAATAACASVCRSSAYRLLQEVQVKGDAAFHDGRHGHPSKLPEAVLQWLLAICRADPQMPSRAVRAVLQEQFSIHVSIGHLNRVRAQLGIGNHVGRLKKNSKYPVPRRRLSGTREPVDSFLSLLFKKQVCCQP